MKDNSNLIYEKKTQKTQTTDLNCSLLVTKTKAKKPTTKPSKSLIYCTRQIINQVWQHENPKANGNESKSLP